AECLSGDGVLPQPANPSAASTTQPRSQCVLMYTSFRVGVGEIAGRGGDTPSWNFRICFRSLSDGGFRPCAHKGSLLGAPTPRRTCNREATRLNRTEFSCVVCPRNALYLSGQGTTSMTEADEVPRELLRRAADGDQGALAELLTPHRGWLKRM